MPYPLAVPAPTPPYNGTEACAGNGSSIFFSRDPQDLAHARLLCQACPMRAACDTWALEHEEFGLWAGRTAGERKRIRRDQKIVLHRPEARGVRGTADEQALAA